MFIRVGSGFYAWDPALVGLVRLKPDPTHMLAAERSPNPRQMMEAVPKRVVLHEELTRQRGVAVQRDGGRAIERFVADRSNGRCRLPAVALKKIQRFGLFDRSVLSRMFGVHLMNRVPCDAGDRLSGGQRLRQLDLERVYARHVMHDDADEAAVLRHRSLPFLRAERLDKGSESICSLLNASGEGLCTLIHGNPLSKARAVRLGFRRA